MTDEDRLYHDADLARFYDIDNGWADDLSYCRGLAEGCASLLDLGCGTGLFGATMAATIPRVVGVDPAQAMLDIAAARPGGDKARWVTADARSVRLGETFDLIVMTGHAFQVFLTRADRLAVLKTIALHLSPQGRFIFDSRNPELEEWREWTPALSERQFTHPQLGEMFAWNDVSHDPSTGIVTYQTHYRHLADDRTDSASSQLAFASRAEIEELAGEGGLRVERWLGDWRGRAWTEDAREIIPVGRLAV